jgi:hypothetical protein
MNAATPGWYQDPEAWESERYWDGTQWTEDRREKIQPTDAAAVSTVEPAEMVSPAEPTSTLFGRRTPEQRAEREAAKQRTAEEKARARAEGEALRAAQEFAQSPVGLARAAFDRGDQVFQYSIDVMSQAAIIVAMVGSATAKRTTDPSAVLNGVAREGWELINGSFVFVEEGAQSRDKFMSSGQNVAIKGATFGYYLFKRNPALRQG